MKLFRLSRQNQYTEDEIRKVVREEVEESNLYAVSQTYGISPAAMANFLRGYYSNGKGAPPRLQTLPRNACLKVGLSRRWHHDRGEWVYYFRDDGGKPLLPGRPHQSPAETYRQAASRALASLGAAAAAMHKTIPEVIRDLHCDPFTGKELPPGVEPPRDPWGEVTPAPAQKAQEAPAPAQEAPTPAPVAQEAPASIADL